MAQEQTFRPRVLTNSAAEFIENRAEETLGSELASAGGQEFVPCWDQFTSRRNIPDVDYTAESAKHMRQLELTLKNFTKTIENRGYDKKLKIAIKKPADYDLTDVLEIAAKVEDNHRNGTVGKDSMGRIRKCFRSIGEHHGQLKSLLKFVPNDTYGSVITGGLTIILGAVERADTVRNEIYEALVDVPDILKEMSDFADIPYQSEEFMRRGDALFVAIFSVLEHIIDELTKSVPKKGFALIFKGDKYSFQVTEAIKEMKKQRKAFRIRAEICAQQKLGRIEQIAMSSEIGIARLGHGTADIQQRLIRLERQNSATYQRIERLVLQGRSEEANLVRSETFQAHVYNQVYAFLTGNPSFDSKTGSVDLLRLVEHRKELAYMKDPKSSARFLAKRNRKAVKAWIDHIQPVHQAIKMDVSSCLSYFDGFTLVAKEQVRWIMTRDELHNWLRLPKSALLVVEPETQPETVENPISFSSALVSKLVATQDYPTLFHFCGLRAGESMSTKISGPKPMLASLFAQLLKQIKKKRPSLDFSELGNPEDYPDYRRSVKQLAKCFSTVVESLPQQDSIFIVIDSAKDLTGSRKKTEEVISNILDLVDTSDATIKILLTGVIYSSILEDREYMSLVLPDITDDGCQDIHPAFLQGETLAAIEDFEDSRSEDTETETESEGGDSEEDAW